MIPILYNSFQKNFYEEIVTIPKTVGLEYKTVDLSMVLKSYIQLWHGREQSWKHLKPE